MSLLTDPERRFLSAVSQLAYCNPFLPERTVHERAALGRDFVAGGTVWSASVKDPDAPSPNVMRIHARLEPVLEKIRERLPQQLDANSGDTPLYEECAHHLIYQTFYGDFVSAKENWRFYERFAAAWSRYLPPGHFETSSEAPHFFACFRQVQRAFHNIFDNIIGNSMPAAQLRASA